MNTPTPRTDERDHWQEIAKTMSAEREHNANVAQAMTAERDQLRAENATLRAAQKACEACDEPTAFEVRQLRADLAAERARLDWLQAQEVKRGLEIMEGRDDPLPFLVLGEDGTTHWGNTYRAAIDEAMKEGAK